MKAVDYFAGGGGWDVACALRGWPVVGHEYNPDALNTRAAAGHKSSEIVDVRDVSARAGEFDLQLASPPCQSFSNAGKGVGRLALDAVLAVVDSYRDGHPLTYAQAWALTGDERTALVVEPLRLALQGLPTFVTWEQVPAVLPVWEACADVLRRNGYSVASGLLNAEQYGVPQTRKRAILVARRDGVRAFLPVPTHSRYYSRTPDRLDAGVLPWVSMATALGCDGAALIGFPRLDDNRHDGCDAIMVDGVAYRARDLRAGSHPALSVTEKSRSWQVFDVRLRNNTSVKAGVRGLHEPSPTMYFGARLNSAHWEVRDDRTALVARRRLDVDEASALQSFPAGYPWRGTRTAQFLQVGNAIPPLLAHAILSTFVDSTGWELVA